MSLWDELLRMLGWGEKPQERRERPRQERPSPLVSFFEQALAETVRKRPLTRRMGRAALVSLFERGRVAPGTILSGRVEYVGDTFAKVASGVTRAVVFLGEMADHHVSNPSEVLFKGQTVDFIVIERSTRNLDEWVASLVAVGEARSREALAKLNEGDVISGTVAEIKDKGVVVDCESFHAWVPISELAWRWLDHPAEVVRLGQSVQAKVLRKEEPEGWLHDKRARRAKAVASVRACTDPPISPEVEVAMSCLPFKLWAVARKPRACDPVVSYVLEELDRGADREVILANTGLPANTLTRILETLEEAGLARNNELTKRGRRIAEAIQWARELNADPIRGLFASAAHPRSQFLPADVVDESRDYPRDWPRPPYNRQAEDTFARATDDELPEFLLQRIVGDDKRGLLQTLQSDERLRVFLRRDGSRPWKAAWVPVPEHWVLAGLWSAFQAVGSRPYRPADTTERCRDFLMVRLRGRPSSSGRLPEKHQRWLDRYGTEPHGEEDVGLSPEALERLERARRAYREQRRNNAGKPDELTVFFEPATATYWRIRDPSRVKVRDRKGSSFPDFPNLEGLAEDLGHDVIGWSPESWCMVKV